MSTKKIENLQILLESSAYKKQISILLHRSLLKTDTNYSLTVSISNIVKFHIINNKEESKRLRVISNETTSMIFEVIITEFIDQGTYIMKISENAHCVRLVNSSTWDQ